MDRFNALGRGAQIMLVAGVLLIIDSFFNWQEVSGFGVSAWDDIGGILMGLLTIVLVAWIVARLAGVEIPLPFSAAMISAVLAVLILLIVVIKNVQDEYSSFWAWLGIALAIAIAVGAWLEVQAAGGIETLRSEIPKGSASTATEPPPPPVSTPPPGPGTESAPAPPSAPEPPAESPPDERQP